MRIRSYAFLVLLCAGSSASLCQLIKNEPYRITSLSSCASMNIACYPPVVRNLMP
ncbi:hypothetical protein [Pseudomonas akapageensis]|uniref:hypothetical protein n=1 Tax=Pseudomonas akapageensis TaxID=2609961 RepID=UPI00140DF91A|nr:hypothetical protein [Pseudomonas akapageensis]